MRWLRVSATYTLPCASNASALGRLYCPGAVRPPASTFQVPAPRPTGGLGSGGYGSLTAGRDGPGVDDGHVRPELGTVEAIVSAGAPKSTLPGAGGLQLRPIAGSGHPTGSGYRRRPNSNCPRRAPK